MCYLKKSLFFILCLSIRYSHSCMRLAVISSMRFEFAVDVCTQYRVWHNAGPVVNSCERRKMKNHTLIALDSNGSAVTASDVIVLNPVDDSVCNLQCAVGWYDVEYGNAAPFLCAANTEDRTSMEGTATYPISCTSAFFFAL